MGSSPGIPEMESLFIFESCLISETISRSTLIPQHLIHLHLLL